MSQKWKPTECLQCGGRGFGSFHSNTYLEIHPCVVWVNNSFFFWLLSSLQSKSNFTSQPRFPWDWDSETLRTDDKDLGFPLKWSLLPPFWEINFSHTNLKKLQSKKQPFTISKWEKGFYNGQGFWAVKSKGKESPTQNHFLPILTFNFLFSLLVMGNILKKSLASQVQFCFQNHWKWRLFCSHN